MAKAEGIEVTKPKELERDESQASSSSEVATSVNTVNDDSQMQEVLTAGQYYTSRQVARKFGYSDVWVSTLIKNGRIKAIKPAGGQWRIPKSEVDRIEKEGLPPMPRQNKSPVNTIQVSDEKRRKVLPEKKQKDEEGEPERKGFFPFDFSLFGKD